MKWVSHLIRKVFLMIWNMRIITHIKGLKRNLINIECVDNKWELKSNFEIAGV